MSSGVRAASDYINNLLLARGLARDGKPIDFVRALTGGSGSGNGSDGSGAKKTSNDRIGLAGQVLNLVHNLILHHKVSRCLDPLFRGGWKMTDSEDGR